MKKLREKTKARAIVLWFVFSMVAVLATVGTVCTPFYGIPFLLSFFSLVFSVRSAIRNADLIDRHIKMID